MTTRIFSQRSVLRRASIYSNPPLFYMRFYPQVLRFVNDLNFSNGFRIL
ncbi:hypothetical protein LEP1GSC060_1470 [Leptospira weilii serovar Ranarum str. ICFT]|uniref:Uncharacterized protein n=1 Tax=Leptospira weilii serovar Ranarum str. ICFT TaxID=1218598 RepID=N1W7K4_9LEPT|nr:hypothetical protein LEP1GSC060_1470 [Leptospira weilii serovar Ranarum str. ICFT]